MISLPENVKKIIEILAGSGFDAYAVGGCIRDSIMGITPKDYDICTDAKPEETKKCFSEFHTIDTGIKHGTVAVVINKEVYEITTFRTEDGYSDHRHPDKVSFVQSVEEDLARRDFTVNAIAYNDRDGIIDPFCGKADIEKKLIRAVGDPVKRFGEDALRILRGLRFASVYCFDIEKGTADAIHLLKGSLSGIAPERIKSELDRLICGKNAVKILREYSDVIEVIIPEISVMIGYDQGTHYHAYDLWEHTLHTIDRIAPVPVMRYTMLFHDMGKPYVRTVGPEGECHYKGHAAAGVPIAHAIMERLKFDNANRSRAEVLIGAHMDTLPADRIGMRKFINRYGIENAGFLLDIMLADNLSKGDGKFLDSERIDEIKEATGIYRLIVENGDCCFLRDLAISGNDLLSVGIGPGKEIGDILGQLLTAVMEDKVENTPDALIKHAKTLAKRDNFQ